jgi:hypothetical protein
MNGDKRLQEGVYDGSIVSTAVGERLALLPLPGRSRFLKPVWKNTTLTGFQDFPTFFQKNMKIVP